MISYHPNAPDTATPWKYKSDYKTVNTQDVHRIAKGMSHCVWSPIIWKEGERLQKNFLSCEWAALDFDNGEMSLEEAIKTEDYEKASVIRDEINRRSKKV